MNIKEQAKKLKQDIPIIFYVLQDKRTPKLAKVLAIITVGYALSPIDLIPDFIPVLGYLDDLIILPVLILCTIRLIPSNIWEENRKLAVHMNNVIPKKWYYAIPIIMLWIGTVWFLVYIFQ